MLLFIRVMYWRAFLVWGMTTCDRKQEAAGHKQVDKQQGECGRNK
jgi:hypothetical protein